LNVKDQKTFLTCNGGMVTAPLMQNMLLQSTSSLSPFPNITARLPSLTGPCARSKVHHHRQHQYICYNGTVGSNVW